MDIFSLIGLIAGLGLVVFGMVSDGGSLIAFLSPSSFAIVFGGTFGALFISYPFDTIKQIPSHLKLVFGKDNYNPIEYITQISDLAKVARKNGLLALEDKAAEIEDKFLANSIMLIVDAIDPDRVRKIFDSQLDYVQQRHDYTIGFYDRAAGLAPAFGMIGTVIGLINMLANLNASDPDALGAGMSVALITTLYGSVMANLFFTPISNKLQVIHEHEMLCMELVVEGILSIQAGENPKHIEDKLISFLPEKSQEEFTEAPAGGNDEDR